MLFWWALLCALPIASITMGLMHLHIADGLLYKVNPRRHAFGLSAHSTSQRPLPCPCSDAAAVCPVGGPQDVIPGLSVANLICGVLATLSQFGPPGLKFYK